MYTMLKHRSTIPTPQEVYVCTKEYCADKKIRSTEKTIPNRMPMQKSCLTNRDFEGCTFFLYTGMAAPSSNTIIMTRSPICPKFMKVSPFYSKSLIGKVNTHPIVYFFITQTALQKWYVSEEQFGCNVD